MKRFLILICLLFACNLLFAEERTQLFKRDNLEHLISLEKVIDDNKETYFYIMTLEPEETRNNYTACYIYLWGDSEEAAKAIVAGLTETDKYYDYIIDLDLEVSKKTINFSDDSLVYCYYFAIEIE
jgi:hypothetical protein